MTPRIIITIEDGEIKHVNADTQVQVVVCDLDTLGCPANTVSSIGGLRAIISAKPATPWTNKAEDIYSAL